MGYIIQNASELVKIEVEITQAQFYALDSQGVLIFPGETSRIFVPTVAFLQLYDTLSAEEYTGFQHLYLINNAQTNFVATIDATLLNISERFVISFAMNIKHPVNIFGSIQAFGDDLLLAAAAAPTDGAGDGKLTVYGYYVNKI